MDKCLNIFSTDAVSVRAFQRNRTNIYIYIYLEREREIYFKELAYAIVRAGRLAIHLRVEVQS